MTEPKATAVQKQTHMDEALLEHLRAIEDYQTQIKDIQRLIGDRFRRIEIEYDLPKGIMVEALKARRINAQERQTYDLSYKTARALLGVPIPEKP